MGAGSNSTRTAVDSSKKAQELGADAILSVVPYYNKPNQKGLIEHFGAIARAVDLPIILYNIPSRTGVNIPFELVKDVSGVDFSISVEEAQNLITGDKDEYIIPLKITPASKTVADLGDEAFPHVLSSYKTNYDVKKSDRDNDRLTIVLIIVIIIKLFVSQFSGKSTKIFYIKIF